MVKRSASGGGSSGVGGSSSARDDTSSGDGGTTPSASGGSSGSSAALKLSRLNLVDLAGSERAALMGESGERLEESKKINLSLSALAKVISTLVDARGLSLIHI